MSKVIHTKRIKPKKINTQVTDTDIIESYRYGAVSKYCGIFDTFGSREDYKSIENNMSVRSQMSRGHYEYFRSGEAVPKKKKDIIRVCMDAYRNVGLIKNIIDIMSDFGAKGVRLVAANSKEQKFYRGWFKKIRGPERVERFLNLLYRCGNLIIQRTNGKITTKDVKTYQTIGKNLENDNLQPDEVSTTNKIIPIKYTYLNPLNIDIIGEELVNAISAEPIYILKFPKRLKSILSSKKAEDKEIAKNLPQYIKDALHAKQDYIKLENNRISCFYYKKDDWDVWADPMINAIIDDIILLDKMKLADLAALDGAISQIRLWKLGDLDKGIFPTDTAIEKLSEILLSNPGGGAFDIIWGPDLKLDTSKTEVHMFLGGSKYEPVLNSIYAGLGVPPTLTGAATSSGFTNNYISLKTLIQRLEYGRSIVIQWLNEEIELIRKAMGFKKGAVVVFDNMILSDETAEKKLLIELVDRDLLPAETVLEIFGRIPEIEQIKIRKERRSRRSGKLGDKAGPYYNGEKEHDLRKIALQKGLVTPKQLDMSVEETDEELPFDRQLKGKIDTSSDTNKGTGGRPLMSKDKEKRKQKTVKPVGANIGDFVSAIMWAKAAQDKISEIIVPGILNKYQKKNIRQLSNSEYEMLNSIKFGVLSNVVCGSVITEDEVYNILTSGAKIDPKIKHIYNELKNNFIKLNSREPTVDENAVLQASSYSLLQTS